MQQPGYIFGGQTGLTYDQIQKQRDIANELLRANMSTPQNVGEGLSAIGRALAAKAIDKRTSRADDANRAASEERRASAIGSIFGGSASPAPFSPATSSAEVGPAASVANDTMAVLGNFSTLEQQHNLPAGYLSQTYKIESGGNPMAQNPNSSAGGGFQFIDSTAKAYGLTDKFNLGESASAAARLAADNKAVLTQALGREPTAGELYLAHQQGGGGAAKLLANPNARAVDIVGADAVRLNGGNENMTASEFASKWVGKFGSGAPAPAAPTGGVDPANIKLIADLLADPYTPPGEKVMLEQAMAMALQGMDPMRQMEMERARLELDQMRNPTVDPMDAVALEQARLDLEQDKNPTVELTPLEKQYERAKSEGYQGDFVQYQLDLKKAGAPSTSVTVGGDTPPPSDEPLRKKLMEGEGTTWNNYLTAGTTASGMQQDMQLLDQVIELAPTGPISGRLAEMFPGVSDAAGVFQSVVKRVAPSLRVEGSGSQSDIEYNGFLQSLPALQNRPEANRAIAAFLKGKAQVNMDRAAAVAAYQNGEIDAVTARKRIAEIDSRSIMSPEIESLLGALDQGDTGGTAGPAPDGVDQEVWDVMTDDERALFQ